MKRKEVKFREIKSEIRILGVDDGEFIPRTVGKVDVIGVVFRGGYWLNGVMRTRVALDGLDATEKIAKMITKSPHYDQLRVLMLNGVTFAGFNVVDIKKLFELTDLPVIALTKKRPRLESVKEALKNLPDWKERWKAIQNAGEIMQVKTRREAESVYMQVVGVSKEDAEKIVKMSSTRSSVPEPLRVAHIVASSIVKPEVE